MDLIMDLAGPVATTGLASIYQPQLEQLGAQPVAMPFGVAAQLDGPIASGWFWSCIIDEGCLLTTMHMVTHRSFVLHEHPEVDYAVLGLLSGSDAGLINTMREERKACDATDPFSGGFSPTLPRNALAFSMQAGQRSFEMPAGSLHDSTNICMLPSFVERVQGQLPEGAPSLDDAFARGEELNGSPRLLETMRRIDPTSAMRTGAPLHYRALVLEALAEMASHLAKDGPRGHMRAVGVADAVNAALLSSLADPPTLDELADRLFMGRTSLCRRFKAETGTSIGKRLSELRIDEAKRRLARSGEPVAEIARALGYAHAESFSAAFARAEGMGPAAWRKAHRRL